MKKLSMPYPCIGYCIIDARGYCVGCGRPPNLGRPGSETPQKAAADAPSSAAQHASGTPSASRVK